MNRPKLKLNLTEETGTLVKHLLPFVSLVSSAHDRDLAINLLGFNSRGAYIRAFEHDHRYGDMLSVILFLFVLDDPDERKMFWDRITFNDEFLEYRLRELCGFEDESLSVDELDAMWKLDFPY